MSTKNNPELNRLALNSKRMATLTLLLMGLLVLFELLSWLFPDLALSHLGFTFSASMIDGLNVDVTQMPLWQQIACMSLATLPLLVLLGAALNMYRLFNLYAKQQYFSSEAANRLRLVGRAIFYWVIVRVLSVPILSVMMTVHLPAGQRVVTVSLTSTDMIGLFLAACFGIIARILAQASIEHNENQSFI